jgi:hypothetical protein
MIQEKNHQFCRTQKDDENSENQMSKGEKITLGELESSIGIADNRSLAIAHFPYRLYLNPKSHHPQVSHSSEQYRNGL